MHLTHPRARRGSRLLALLAAGGSLAAAAVLPAAPAVAAPVQDEVTIVMVQPEGSARDGTVLSDVVAAMEDEVAPYWAEQSDGALAFTVVEAVDWTTTAAGCDEVDTQRLWQEAGDAAGWSDGPHKHLLLYVTSDAPGCSEVRADRFSYTTFGAGSRFYVTNPSAAAIARAVARTFDAGRAIDMRCDGGVETPESSCEVALDPYDLMGAGGLSTLNPQTAEAMAVKLGTSTDWRSDVSGTGGTYTLTSTGLRTGVRALHLDDPLGTYWIELRTATGWDSWLGDPTENPDGLAQGVLVRHVEGADQPRPTDSTTLLDASPSPRSGWSTDTSGVVATGSSVVLLDGGWTVRVVSATATTAVVSVTRASTTGPIASEWQGWGGARGPLGMPLGDTVCGLSQGGCGQDFVGGSLFWTQETRINRIYGGIRERWNANGRETGALGYPTAEADCTQPHGQCVQDFQNGEIWWSPVSGAHSLTGGIRQAWTGNYGPLLLPVGEAVCGLPRGACSQDFQYGQVWWSPATGGHTLYGGILERWRAQGGQRGVLGLPVGEAVCGLARCAQDFQQGLIWWTPATGAHTLYGGILEHWRALRSEYGTLGFPVGEAVCGIAQGGCGQDFQNGSIFWSPATGAHAVYGGIAQRWNTTGRETGALGYPLGEAVCRIAQGGCGQDFQNGSIFWTPATGAHATYGGIGLTWNASGRERGSLGYATGEAVCGLVHGGCGQDFQRGSIFWTPRYGAHSITGDIAGQWNASGRERGRYGYPTSDPVRRVNGDHQQQFMGGVLVGRFPVPTFRR